MLLASSSPSVLSITNRENTRSEISSLRSKRFRGVQEQRITARKKRGEGGEEGRKETLADKPLDTWPFMPE